MHPNSNKTQENSYYVTYVAVIDSTAVLFQAPKNQDPMCFFERNFGKLYSTPIHVLPVYHKVLVQESPTSAVIVAV
jgi:hypothetical protein